MNLQEIVSMQPRNFKASLKNVYISISLISGGKRTSQAINDAIRFLATLSGLLSLDSFII